MKPLNPVLNQILRQRYLKEQVVPLRTATSAGARQIARQGAAEAGEQIAKKIDSEIIEKVFDIAKKSSIDDVLSTQEGQLFFTNVDDAINALIEKNIVTLQDPDSLAKKVFVDLVQQTEIGQQLTSRKSLPLANEINSRIRQKTVELFPEEELIPPTPKSGVSVPKPRAPTPGIKPPPEVPVSPKGKPKPKADGEEGIDQTLGTVKDIGGLASVGLLALGALKGMQGSSPGQKPQYEMQREEQPQIQKSSQDGIDLFDSEIDKIRSGLGKGKLGQYGGYYYAQ